MWSKAGRTLSKSRGANTSIKVRSSTGSIQSCAAKQSEPEITPTAKKRNSPEETPKVKAKAKAKTKGLVESIDAELNKKLVAASKVKTCYHQTCSKANRLLAEMSSNSSWSWASVFGKELESNRAALRIADPLVDTFLLSELSARGWAKRAICGHGEATVVVALDLLGGDFANKVEDVAKDVKKLHAMQAIMK